MPNKLSKDIQVNIKVTKEGLDASALTTIANAMKSLGVGMAGVVDVGPRVEKALANFKNTSTGVSDATNKITTAINSSSTAFGRYWDSINQTQRFQRILIESSPALALIETARTASTAAKSLESMNAPLRTARDAFLANKTAAETSSKALNRYQEAINQTQRFQRILIESSPALALIETAKRARDVAKSLESMNAPLRAARDVFVTAKTAAEESAKSIGKYQEAINQTQRFQRILKESSPALALIETAKLAREAAKSLDSMNAPLRAARDAFLANKTAAEASSTALNKYQEAINQTQRFQRILQESSPALALIETARVAGIAAKSLESMNAPLRAARDAFTATKVAAEDSSKALNRYQEAINQTQRFQRILLESSPALALIETARVAGIAAKSLELMNAPLRVARDAFLSTKTAAEESAKSIGKYQEAINQTQRFQRILIESSPALALIETAKRARDVAKSLESMNAPLRAARDVFVTAKTAAEESAKSIGKYQEAINQTQRFQRILKESSPALALIETGRVARAAAKSLESMNAPLRKARAEYIALDGSLVGINKRLRVLASGTQRTTRSQGIFTAQTQALANAMNSAHDKVKRYESILGTLGKRFTTILQFRVISQVMQTVTQSFQEAVKSIVDYSQALKDLQAITGATEEEVTLMGEAIKQTSTDTKFLVSEVAEGMKILGQAGLSAAESTAVIKNVANLATGTLSDLASSADLVTSTMRVFDIQATDSTRIVDGFANAVNRSKLTIDKIRTSFNYVGPIAKAAGLSFEETQASLMSLANSGLRASTMGTGLRRILAELAAPSEKLAIAASNAGVALESLNPTSNDFNSVLANLKLVLNDTEAAFDIFGKRGAAAALAITGSMDTYRDMLDTVSATGTASEMAGIQMEGLGIAFRKVTGKLQILMVALGEAGLISILYTVAIGLQNILDLFIAVANHGFGKFIIQVVAATAVVAALAAGVTSLILLSTAFLKIAAAAATTTGATVTLSGATAVLHAQLLKLGVSSGTATAGLSRLTGALHTTRAAAVGTMVTLGKLAVVAGVFIALAYGYRYATTGSKRLAQENKKLSNTFGALSGSASNYSDRLDEVTGNSEKYKDVSVSIISELRETAAQHVEVAAEALAAANSIDLMNNTLRDGGAALAIYQEKLKEIEFQKAAEASRNMEQAIKDQSGWWATLGIEAKEAIQVITAENVIKPWYKLNSAIGAVGDTLGITSGHYEHFQNLMADSDAARQQARSLRAVIDSINDGTISMSDFEEAHLQAMGTPASQRTMEQTKIMDLFRQSSEGSLHIIEELTKRGKYNIHMDGSDIVKVAKDAKLLTDVTGNAADMLQHTLAQTQEKQREATVRFVEDFMAPFDELDAGLKGTEEASQEIKDHLETLGVDDIFNLENNVKQADALVLAYSAASGKIAKLRKEGITSDNIQEFQQALADKAIAESAMTSVANALKLDAESQYIADIAALKIAHLKSLDDLEIENDGARLEAQTELELKHLDDIKKAKQTAAKNRFNEAAKEFDSNETNAKEQATKRLTDLTIALSSAKKKDSEIDNASLQQFGPNVYAAKVAAKEAEITTTKKQVDAQRLLLATMQQEAKGMVGAIEDNTEYQKHKTTFNNLLTKQAKLESQLIDLDKSKQKAIRDAEKAEKEYVKAQQARTYWTRELARAEAEARIEVSDDDDSVKIKQIQGLKEAAHRDSIRQIDEQIEASKKLQQQLSSSIETSTDDTAKDILEKQLSEQKLLHEGLAADKKELQSDYVIYKIESGKEITDAEKSESEERVSIAEEEYNKKLKTEESYKKLKAALDAESGNGTGQEDLAQIRLDSLQELWKAAGISATNYKIEAELALGDGAQFDNQTDKIEAIGSAWENVVHGFSTGGEQLGSLNKQFKDLGTTAKVAFEDGLNENIHAFATGTKSAKEAMNDFFSDFLEQIAKAILKQIVFNAIRDTGTSSGGADGGWAGLLSGAVMSMFSNGGLIPAYADGGTVKGGGMITGYSPSPKADNIIAKVTAGEYVIPVAAVQKLGLTTLESLRRGILPTAQYATGGLVQGIKSINTLPNFNLGGIVQAQSFIPAFANGGAVQSTTTNVAAPNVSVQPQEVNITNISDTDASNKGWLDSAKGEKTMLNFMSKNQSVLKAMMR